MIDRYTITLNANELALVLGIEVPENYHAQFNAAPTKSLPIITSTEPGKTSFFKWGLMAMWSNNKTMSPKFFNLPIQSVVSKPSYRKKLATNRCIIPMDGFYLWKKVAKKQQVPHYFFYPDRKVFSVAGLWEENEDGDPSFIMITQSANDQIMSFQDDMPVIMDASSSKKWLESIELKELEMLLHKSPKDSFLSHTVAPKIKNIDENDHSFIQPAPPADQHGNYTLFT